MFDIFNGWPFAGALTDNAEPLTGAAIVSSMAIVKDANGKLIKSLGTEPKVFWSLEDQDSPSVVMAGKMAYLVNNAILLTDQYDTTADYTTYPQVMVDAGNPGKVIVWDADPTKPVVGFSDGFVERDGYTYLKVIIS